MPRCPDALPWLPRPLWLALCWALVAGVTALMLMPSPPRAFDSGWDKLNHVLAFLAPTVAGSAALARRDGWRLPALWAALLAWGAALEWLQGRLPPRTADPLDWVADAVGVALGAALFAALVRRQAVAAGRRPATE